MLPFLKNKKEASVSMPSDYVKRESDNPEEDSGYDSLESAMQELHDAQMRKDHKGAAAIFRSAIDLAGDSPKEEDSEEE